MEKTKYEVFKEKLDEFIRATKENEISVMTQEKDPFLNGLLVAQHISENVEEMENEEVIYVDFEKPNYWVSMFILQNIKENAQKLGLSSDYVLGIEHSLEAIQQNKPCLIKKKQSIMKR